MDSQGSKFLVCMCECLCQGLQECGEDGFKFKRILASMGEEGGTEGVLDGFPAI